MNNTPAVAVTYTGNDQPFLDRIYGSGLTFTHGQTRVVPVTLAQRFLRHSDVFQEGEAEAVKVPEPTPKQTQTDPDTAAVLALQNKEHDEQREQSDARFALLESLETMDRAGLIEWADVHYKQKIPGNLSAAKAREMAKGFVDQYGMPA